MEMEKYTLYEILSFTYNIKWLSFESDIENENEDSVHFFFYFWAFAILPFIFSFSESSNIRCILDIRFNMA